jgi:CheY-like chemotaxis protein
MGVKPVFGEHWFTVGRIVSQIGAGETIEELLVGTKATVDGVQAVEKFKASPEGYYDFIFMDLLMPNMNGYDAARNIRNLTRSDAVMVPIFALSANAYQEDISQAMAAGMNGHIAKPVNFAELMGAPVDWCV